MHFSFTRISGNTKTGQIPTTMSESSTCPSICPLKNAGCYAAYWPTAMHWNRLSDKGISFAELCSKIAALPDGQLWRHNVAGDLPMNASSGVEFIDGAALRALTKANKGKRGFTYTHHDMTIGYNRVQIAKSNAYGFTVNLSANNLEHVDELLAYEIAPVAVVVPMDTPKVFFTPKGNKGIICPATYLDNVTCASCQLCQRANRDCIVGFPVHGTAKKKALVNSQSYMVISIIRKVEA